MKKLLIAFIFLFSNHCFSQKYVLIDKKMLQPISYTNVVSAQNNINNLFPVEKNKLPQFLSQLQKIAALLVDTKRPLPEIIDVSIGKTRFFGVRVSTKKEPRLDIVLTTDCEGNKIMMHLSEAKVSNNSNAYFITTWIKYIKSYLK